MFSFNVFLKWHYLICDVRAYAIMGHKDMHTEWIWKKSINDSAWVIINLKIWFYKKVSTFQLLKCIKWCISDVYIV